MKSGKAFRIREIERLENTSAALPTVSWGASAAMDPGCVITYDRPYDPTPWI